MISFYSTGSSPQQSDWLTDLIDLNSMVWLDCSWRHCWCWHQFDLNSPFRFPMMENKLTYLEPSLEKQLKGHRNGITALYFSPNEQQIASSSLDNSVLVTKHFYKQHNLNFLLDWGLSCNKIICLHRSYGTFVVLWEATDSKDTMKPLWM